MYKIDVHTLIILTGPGLKATIQQQIKEVGIDISKSDDIAGKMASYVLQSRAPSTTEKYSGCFKSFEKFCDSMHLSCRPANAMSVAIYISHMLDNGKSYSVISSAIYAIKWIHSIHGLADPTDSSFVKHLCDAAKRLRSKPKNKKDVVDSTMLIDLCTLMEKDMSLTNVRDLAMILLCYAGFLRYNEMSNLRCSDVNFQTDHIVLKIRLSKTGIYREGREVLIAKGSTIACPYIMLPRYMNLAGLDETSDEFLFKPVLKSKASFRLITKNKKISYTRAKECIVSKLSLVAPNLKLGTHTLRASGATSAANADGISDRCIKRHGRWKTDQAKDGYIKDSLDKKLLITKSLKL